MKLNIRRTIPQLIATISVTFCSICDGMSFGWTSPIIPILKANYTYLGITDVDETWLENIYMIGNLAGLGVTIWILTTFGIKPSITYGAVCHLISWTLICILGNKICLYVARFVSGAAGNLGFVSIPMYIAEISYKDVRGFFGAVSFVNYAFGWFLMFSIGPFVSVRASSSIGIIFAVFQLISFSFIPGSPYNYLVHGKKEKALKSLKWFRNSEEVLDEFDEISKAVERQESEKGRFFDLFLVKSNRKALTIITVLKFMQSFSGFVVFPLNVHQIIVDASSDISPGRVGIYSSVVVIISTLIFSFIIDKVGRRTSLIGSSIVAGIATNILGIYFLMKDFKYDITTITWLPFVLILIHAGAMRLGLGSVPVILVSELYPTNVKANGMALSDVNYAFFGFLSITFYMYSSQLVGTFLPIFVFAAISYLTSIFVIFYVPETAGKTLEEIQMILQK